MILEKIDQLLKEVGNLKASNAEEIEQLRLKYLSKKGEITALMADFRNVAADQKKAVGMKINELKQLAMQKINELKEQNEVAEESADDFDLTRSAYPIQLGTRHPLNIVKNQIIDIFQRMGFTLAEGPEIDDDLHVFTKLNFAADHPARDMQDTFFLEHPEHLDLEDGELVAKIKAIHENGGDAGSSGWGGEWSEEKASQALLRTHSTVSSIRYIAAHPDAPQKAFSISRIFRKESIDATHLPEFSQIEGIVIDKNANLDMLISLIREFYARMGFDKIHVRPSYFPYTEPSLELEVFFNGKWLELGGAGIFRPEVLAPFGVKYPVLAWGFGFERLAMLKWNIKDIRDLYISDIDSLRKNTVF